MEEIRNLVMFYLTFCVIFLSLSLINTLQMTYMMSMFKKMQVFIMLRVTVKKQTHISAIKLYKDLGGKKL